MVQLNIRIIYYLSGNCEVFIRFIDKTTCKIQIEMLTCYGVSIVEEVS